MQTYIGVKMIQAEPEGRNGEPGYRVVYPDGYVSWSPAEAFERAYFPLEEGEKHKLCEADVDGFLLDVNSFDLPDSKSTLVSVTTRSGFTLLETSSCVDAKNYSATIGREQGKMKAKGRLWEHLGFVLQWAVFGLRRRA